MIIKKEDLFNFFATLTETHANPPQEIIIPAHSQWRTDDQRNFKIFKPTGADDNFTLDGYRPIFPLKNLFYITREALSTKTYEGPERIIAGVKACDLKALQLLDKALINEDFVDPSYKFWRQKTILIASDCTEVGNTCHCILVDGKPYAEQGYDINLSPLQDDTYLVHIGSDKGQALVDHFRKSYEVRDNSDETQNQVDQNRQQIIEQLQEQNRQYDRTKTYDTLKAARMDVWKQSSAECIGCGACTNICPTCYCLILNDESTDAAMFKKVRSLDSCQLHGYARVAGGASPRPKMEDRFRHRYLCKFLYMQSNFDMLGCTGCGRCSDACAAEIEFREATQKALFNENKPIESN
ncbi:MAG: hypothetical protein GF313_03595 [Caldithrix sp.]|nr:hypothetical protein [Caldithrix sp.]